MINGNEASSLTSVDWRLFVAIFALMFSLLSIFIQYFLPSRIRVILGEPFGLFCGKEGKLNIRVPTTIFNEGARNTAIVKIQGRITEVNSGRSMSFLWRAFSESKNVGVEGEEFRPHYAFSGWAHALVLPARDAVFKVIQFRTWDSFSLSPGCYTLEFQIMTGVKSKVSASTKATVEISQEDSKFVVEKCQANEKGIAVKTLSKFTEESKRH